MPVTENHTATQFPFKKALQPAVCSALIDYWGSDDIVLHPEILVDLGPVALSRINRIWRKSLYKIAQVLAIYGYIASAESWLSGVE